MDGYNIYEIGNLKGINKIFPGCRLGLSVLNHNLIGVFYQKENEAVNGYNYDKNIGLLVFKGDKKYILADRDFVIRPNKSMTLMEGDELLKLSPNLESCLSLYH
jgi:hypothetical protein